MLRLLNLMVLPLIAGSMLACGWPTTTTFRACQRMPGCGVSVSACARPGSAFLETSCSTCTRNAATIAWSGVYC